MSRREEWKKVLDAELARWSRMSYENLVSDVREIRAYEAELDSKRYQVEVEILEHTSDHVLVSVSVDDGSLPQSTVPLTTTFTRHKEL